MPYAFDSNDMRFASPQGFNSGDQFFTYLKDTFDVLYRECPGVFLFSVRVLGCLYSTRCLATLLEPKVLYPKGRIQKSGVCGAYWMMIFCCCVFTPPCAVCAVTVITASPVGNGGVK